MKNEELYGSSVKAREDRFVAREALGGLIGSYREAQSSETCTSCSVRWLRATCQEAVSDMGIFGARGYHCGREQVLGLEISFSKIRIRKRKMANGYRPTHRMSECKARNDDDD